LNRGAVQLTIADTLPNVPVTDVGGPGTVVGINVAPPDADVATRYPLDAVAVIVTK
jgi:hypothetical protein